MGLPVRQPPRRIAPLGRSTPQRRRPPGVHPCLTLRTGGRARKRHSLDRLVPLFRRSVKAGGYQPGGRGTELRDRPFPAAPRPLYIGLWTVITQYPLCVFFSQAGPPVALRVGPVLPGPLLHCAVPRARRTLPFLPPPVRVPAPQLRPGPVLPGPASIAPCSVQARRHAWRARPPSPLPRSGTGASTSDRPIVWGPNLPFPGRAGRPARVLAPGDGTADASCRGLAGHPPPPPSSLHICCGQGAVRARAAACADGRGWRGAATCTPIRGRCGWLFRTSLRCGPTATQSSHGRLMWCCLGKPG